VKTAGATPTELAGGVTVATAGGAKADVVAVSAAGGALAGGGAPPPKAKVADDVSAAGGGGGGELNTGGADVDVDGGVGTLTRGIMAALAMYASIVLGEELFWLMDMAIPFSQWLVWPQ